MSSKKAEAKKSYEEAVLELPSIIGTGDAAYILGCSSSKIQQMARDGQIPSFRIGAEFRFRRDALIEITGATYESLQRTIYERQVADRALQREFGTSDGASGNKPDNADLAATVLKALLSN